MGDFVDTVEDGLANNDVKLSIVPFNDYVRIPTSYGSANWIEVQPDEEYTYQVLDNDNSVNCRQVGSGESRYTECDDYVTKDVTRTATWIGCMASRKDDYHKTADYDNRALQGFNGKRAGCYDSYTPLLTLTSTVSTLKSTINDLSARGSTYIPAGLIWGWRTLSPNEPFTESFPVDPDTKNLLVLMTDGANTRSIRGEEDSFLYHWGVPKSATSDQENANIANQLTLEICSNIKEAGIELVTIAYEVTDTATLTMLQNCASKADNYYNAQNSEALKSAFKNLGRDVEEVRLIR